MLATGSTDKTVKIHAIRTGSGRVVLKGHTGAVLDVQYHPLDNNMVASGANSYTATAQDCVHGF